MRVLPALLTLLLLPALAAAQEPVKKCGCPMRTDGQPTRCVCGPCTSKQAPEPEPAPLGGPPVGVRAWTEPGPVYVYPSPQPAPVQRTYWQDPRTGILYCTLSRR
jgi:hypothetical protein